MALGLPAILATWAVHWQARKALTTTPTLTPGGTAMHGTMATLAVRASPHVTWKRTMWGGVAAVTTLVVLVAGWMTLRSLGIGPAGSLFAAGTLADQDKVLVADFTVSGADSTLGTVVADAMRTNLEQSRAITVVPIADIGGALERMQRPVASKVDLALAREIAAREGIKAIVHGNVTAAGAGFILTARLITAESGVELASFRQAAGDATELIPAIDRVTRELRGKIGESLKTVRSAPALEQVTTASLPALRLYAAAYRANYLEGDFLKAAAAAESAIVLDTTFAMAYRLAALGYSNGRFKLQRADSLRQRAYALRARLPEYERALAEGAYGTGTHDDRALRIRSFRRAVELRPRDAASWNNLALNLSANREYAAAESAYRRGIAAGDNIFNNSNLSYLLANQGRLDEALREAEKFRAKFPTAPLAIYAGWSVWAARNRFDSVDAQCRRLLAPAIAANLRATGNYCLGSLAMRSGKLRERYRYLSAGRSIDSARGFTGFESSALDSSRIMIWLLERHPEGLKLLDQHFARLKPDEPLRNRGYFTAAGLYAVAGRPDRARAMLERFRSEADTADLRVLHSNIRFANGQIAVAERRYGDAIREFLAADTIYHGLPNGCVICTWPSLGHAYDLAGMPDSAIAVFERYLKSTHTQRWGGLDDLYLFGIYKRLGELHESRNDRQAALGYFLKAEELWKNADPELQPKVREVRARIERLRDTERR
jgi:eukaryotic-like serine/threonine-protein kinase